MSLPSRERGLKCFLLCICCRRMLVAPFAGAWIEIYKAVFRDVCDAVAPFAGAWIEMLTFVAAFVPSAVSLPSRERGLKSRLPAHCLPTNRRSLRGSVD